MTAWTLISIAIFALLVLIGIILLLIVWRKRGIVGEPNYQVFFTLGFVWLPVGVVFILAVNPAIGFAFMALGIAYLAIGLANRDKWEKKK